MREAGQEDLRESKEPKGSPEDIERVSEEIKDFMESLILAQDERWRRA